jgi:hypothetical protein
MEHPNPTGSAAGRKSGFATPINSSDDLDAALEAYLATLPILPKGSPPDLITSIKDAALGVLHEHGVAAFAAPREAAIAHEVGHAIVGTHEGFTIRQINNYSRATPHFGLIWSGRCEETAATWESGPHTPAEEDLRRARFAIAGLIGEVVTRFDKPGSSLDELVLSQFLGTQAGKKLNGGYALLTEEACSAYMRQLWNEQVWKATISILYANQESFHQLAGHLHQHERVKGDELRKALTQVKRIAS